MKLRSGRYIGEPAELTEEDVQYAKTNNLDAGVLLKIRRLEKNVIDFIRSQKRSWTLEELKGFSEPPHLILRANEDRWYKEGFEFGNDLWHLSEELGDFDVADQVYEKIGRYNSDPHCFGFGGLEYDRLRIFLKLGRFSDAKKMIKAMHGTFAQETWASSEDQLCFHKVVKDNYLSQDDGESGPIFMHTEELLVYLEFEMTTLNKITEVLESWHKSFLANLPSNFIADQFKNNWIIQDKIREHLFSYDGGNDIDAITSKVLARLENCLKFALKDSKCRPEDRRDLQALLLNVYDREMVRNKCEMCASDKSIPLEDHLLTHGFFKNMGPAKNYILSWIKTNLLQNKDLDLGLENWSCVHSQGSN